MVGDASLSGKERKSRQQKSKRKSTASNVVDDKEDEKEVDLDPSANMIVETFEPILVSVHQDSFIRFWSNEVCTYSCSTLVINLEFRDMNHLSSDWLNL